MSCNKNRKIDNLPFRVDCPLLLHANCEFKIITLGSQVSDNSKKSQPAGKNPNKTIKYATTMMDSYKLGSAKREVEQFFWHTLCDNYLEVIKDRLYNPDKRGKEARASAQYALYQSILSVLKMMAPVVPHITEEIYQGYFAEKEGKKSIHISYWPAYDENEVDEAAEKTGDIAVDIIGTLRRYKSEKNLSLKVPITKLEIHCETDLQDTIKLIMADIKDAAAVEEIVFGTTVDTPCSKFPIELGITLGEIKKKE